MLQKKTIADLGTYRYRSSGQTNYNKTVSSLNANKILLDQKPKGTHSQNKKCKLKAAEEEKKSKCFN